MSTIPIDDKLVIGPDRANIDARYKASNNRPYTSVAAAEAAINLVIGNVGLTVLVADENEPDYPKAKEYWVQPKGTTPETYGLVEKGAGTTDYTDLDNKPTINNVPLSDNKTASDLGLATAAQGGKADTAIQGVSVNGTEVTPDPTTKKVALTIENGKSAYQLYLDDYEDKHGSTDGALNEAAWLESLQGKSALQIYNETMNTSLDEAGFINVLKQNYPMEYVAYDQTAAGQSIGTAFAAIDQLAASASTAGKLYLMPNNGTTPKGTELFITVQTGATTYMWYRLGALSVPSNVLTEDKIVQNLNTGGADKVLSAEAGKELNVQLYGGDGEIEESDNYATVFTNDITSPYTKAVSLTKVDPVYDGNPASGNKRMNFIPINEFAFKIKGKYTHLKVTGKNTDYDRNAYVLFVKKLPEDNTDLNLADLAAGGYFCDGYDSENLSKNIISIAQHITKTIPIPHDAVSVLISRTCLISGALQDRDPSSVVFTKAPHLDGDIDNLKEHATSITSDFESLTEMNETTVDLDNCFTQNTDVGSKNIGYYSNAILYRIPVIGYKEVKIKRNKNCYLILCKEELPETISGTTLDNLQDYVDVNCEGYEIDSSSMFRMVIRTDDEVTIKLNEGIKYLYVQKILSGYATDYTPKYVKLCRLAIKAGTNKDISVFGGVYLRRGALGADGKMIDDANTLVSNLIPLSNGFILETKEGYNVKQCALYDAQGDCINTNFWKSSQNARFIKGWSTSKQLCNCHVRVVIAARTNADSTTVPIDVIEKFGYVADARLKTEIPNGFPMRQVNERKSILSNVFFIPTAPMPRASKSFYTENTAYIGIPYSEVNEYDKFVGSHVSLRTFLTAVKNKHSVLYTERIRDINAATNPGTTKYGFNYHGTLAAQGTFYGTVCSGLVAYLMGKNNICLADNYNTIYNSNIYAKNGVNDYITIKNEGNFVASSIDELWDIIQPLDLWWSTGHNAIVTNVYKDIYGATQIIEVAEASSWQVYTTPYTKEQFMFRIKYERDETNPQSSWSLIRIPNEFGNTSPDKDDLLLTQGFMDFNPKDVDVDPDISTFAGEYAAFAINADNDNTDDYNNYKAYLNVHRGGSKYDTLEIYAENGNEPIRTQDISVIDGNIIIQSDIYDEDASANEDWIIVDLTKLSSPLTAGKYKAKLTGSNAESGLTHFEMVDISLSYNAETHVVSFASTEGTPYLIRRERSLGTSTSTTVSQELSQEDVNNNNITIDWSFDETDKYIKLFVRAEYGVVVKRIEIN